MLHATITPHTLKLILGNQPPIFALQFFCYLATTFTTLLLLALIMAGIPDILQLLLYPCTMKGLGRQAS